MASNTKNDAPAGVPGLRISARAGAFRRAGLLFGAQPVEIMLRDLKDAQVTALRGEPALVVVDITIAPPAPAAEQA